MEDKETDKQVYQEVECISTRGISSFKDPVIGIHYYLNLTSIYLDSDGDAYGMIFTQNNGEIIYSLGYKLLKHFKTVV